MKATRVIERSEVAKDWHARGYSCGLWIDHAGRTWKGTTHDTEELFMMLSGRLEFEMQGSRFEPEVGQEVLIPAGVQHTIRNIGGKTARWFYGQKLHNQLPKH
ncbi:MAG: cupin domain-containing protein [Nitrospirales bacterium]|nr:cupin domain-containing protein [Nitrospira sp.]MDR4500275.1 cupin domain-containing protein [Nitrospirales bacterium]